MASKMMFSVESALASGGRLGYISNAGHNGNISVETPMCTLFTKGGSVPYLSLDMLQKIARVPSIATMSIGTLADHHESVAKFGHGLASFTAMKDKVIFTTMHDASLSVFSGKNDKSSIAVWGKGGKVKIDPALYKRILEAFQPDWFLSMGDGDTDTTCTRKRLVRAVDRTLDFLDTLVDSSQNSEVLQGSNLIGVVEGGYSLEERKRSAKETATRPVQGFLIEGFEKGHSGVDLFEFEDFPSILKETIAELPSDFVRLIETCWSPLQVVKAFRMGVDIFSSAYPHTLTEKGFALVGDYNLPPTVQAPVPHEDSMNGKASLVQGTVLDLKEKRYFDDFGSLHPTCECYTCKNFTCSYIHHLLNTSELLAYVLLTMHNFHQYFEFFHRLRIATKENRVEDFENYLTQQDNGFR